MKKVKSDENRNNISKYSIKKGPIGRTPLPLKNKLSLFKFSEVLYNK
jgi:hypothetical protein